MLLYEVDPPAGYIVTNTSGITMKQNGITKFQINQNHKDLV